MLGYRANTTPLVIFCARSSRILGVNRYNAGLFASTLPYATHHKPTDLDSTPLPPLPSSASGQGLSIRAALLMTGSTVLFGFMVITIRLATSTTHPFEIAFFRNLFGLLFALPLLWGSGLALLHTKRLRFYFLRCVIGLGGMLTSFWALAHLPLAQAIAISYSSPLFVIIGAALLLNEVIRIRRTSAVIVGFIGVLIIIHPVSADLNLATLVAVLAAALVASAAISIKFLSRTERADAIVIYMGLIMTPLALIPALFYWQWPDAMGWLWLVLTGFFGTMAQICMTRAYQLGEVSALTPLNFLQLPLVAVLAWCLFGETLTWNTAFGAVIVIGSNVYITHREAVLSRQRTSAI